ncbi:intradiol ring-cleavage dioxygenase [Amphritea sp.]|uniref:intradiol ring-cleavage dioxygenase n=1 Tax=Amphritea sp. TaxID=1872502 RepID=UPI0025BFFAEC|nr:intradiol ring-cleavage dioxygenase [Amphritea sp.]
MSITEQNLTDIVVSTLNSDDPRLNQVMESLIRHLHGFIREVEPSDEEWMAGIQYLTEVGQMCNDVRQEYILLSDTLGVTVLKDSLNNKKPEGATEVSVLGPFYREGAEVMPLGASISRGENDGQPCVVRGRVTTPDGTPIAGAVMDAWQAASTGFYEQQDENQPEMNLRGRFKTDENGYYHFKTVKPKNYPIPGDGPVGKMLDAVGRHNYRPAHIHFIVSAEGYELVITQFFDATDEYVTSDAVFGVKESLLVDFQEVTDPAQAAELNLPVGGWLVEFNFGLNPE